MTTEKRTAESEIQDEADRKALNPNGSKQKISDSQALPECIKIVFKKTAMAVLLLNSRKVVFVPAGGVFQERSRCANCRDQGH